MNDAGSIAFVDTSRDELRERINEARQRFYRLTRSADPQARRRGLDWSVHQVIAHVLCVARRYEALAEGRDFRRAHYPRELDQINQEEMMAAMAPVPPELLDRLSALEPVMDAFFDGLPDDYVAEFHCGAVVSGVVTQINWLFFDLILHGEDIARSVDTPWEVRERDMLLLLREGGLEVAPAYLSAAVTPTTNICLALQIPDARPMWCMCTMASQNRGHVDHKIGPTLLSRRRRRRWSGCCSNASDPSLPRSTVSASQADDGRGRRSSCNPALNPHSPEDIPREERM